MTLLSRYDEAALKGHISHDPKQRQMLVHLQAVADKIIQPKNSWFRRGKKNTVKGLYLYGPVGGGKTFLMDLFFEYVKINKKSRFHFHHFMQQVDAQLRRLQGQSDPLRRIAADFSKRSRVLCLDEFLVHDIADAMILAELLKALFEHNVVLVATSNTRPDDLYRNGLQRARFLPAIELIKQHCDVLSLTDNCDYRLGRTPLLEAYLYPLNEATANTMEEQFEKIAPATGETCTLTIQNREVLCVKCSERAVWFQFDSLCNIPRSQLDYLEIASRFDTVFLSAVPILTPNDVTKALLFMHFIDVMYDKGVRVIISAEGSPEKIYQQGSLVTSFQRTLSRLHEMQSVDYLIKAPVQ